MTPNQHRQLVDRLSAEGERRARAAGVSGSVSLNEYLTPEEQQQLLQSLRALDWQKPTSLSEFTPVSQS
jgi:hypothetical protein